jgi:hypothetical protein
MPTLTHPVYAGPAILGACIALALLWKGYRLRRTPASGPRADPVGFTDLRGRGMIRAGWWLLAIDVGLAVAAFAPA